MSLVERALALRQEEMMQSVPKGKETRRKLRAKGQVFQKPDRNSRRSQERKARHEKILARGELRHDVIVRANGKCEWCLTPITSGELHHVLQGNGRRRQDERLETVAFICLPCHRAWHNGLDMDVYLWALQWAAQREFREAKTEIQYRIDKAREAKWARFGGAA